MAPALRTQVDLTALSAEDFTREFRDALSQQGISRDPARAINALRELDRRLQSIELTSQLGDQRLALTAELYYGLNAERFSGELLQAANRAYAALGSTAEQLTDFITNLPEGILVLTDEDINRNISQMYWLVSQPALRASFTADKLGNLAVQLESALYAGESAGRGEGVLHQIRRLYEKIVSLTNQGQEVSAFSPTGTPEQPMPTEFTVPVWEWRTYQGAAVVVEIPYQLGQGFSQERRAALAESWARGVEQQFRNDGIPQESFGASVIGIMLDDFSVGLGRTVSEDELLQQNDQVWGNDLRDFLINRLGKYGSVTLDEEVATYEAEIVKILRLIRAGDFVGALEQASHDTTLARLAEHMITTTFNNSPDLVVIVPQIVCTVGFEMTAFENTNWRITGAGFVKTVYNQRYRPHADVVWDEQGNPSVQIRMQDAGSETEVGGGGGASVEYFPTDQSYRVELSVSGEYDPVAKEGALNISAEFVDQGLIFHGHIYPQAYLSYSLLQEKIMAGGEVQVPVPFLQSGDFRLLLVLGADYFNNLEQGTQSLVFRPGMRIGTEHVQIGTAAIWEVLQDNQVIGGMGSVSFAFGGVGVDIAVQGTRTVPVRIIDTPADQVMITGTVNYDLFGAVSE